MLSSEGGRKVREPDCITIARINAGSVLEFGHSKEWVETSHNAYLNRTAPFLV